MCLYVPCPIAGFYLEHPGMSKVIPGTHGTCFNTPEKHPGTLRHHRTVRGSPGHLGHLCAEEGRDRTVYSRAQSAKDGSVLHYKAFITSY